MVSPTTAAEPSTRKRPGKAVLIRLAIYVPLLSFFGWQAATRALAERDAADDAFRTDMSTWLESPPGAVELTHAIPIEVDAELSAPPETGETSTGDTTGDDATGTTSTGETGTTGTTGDTSTGTGTGDTGTGDTGTTSETGGAPEPADATSTSTTTTGP